MKIMRFRQRDLEQAPVQNLPRFLAEMGGMFTFVGNQYRLGVGGQVRGSVSREWGSSG